MAEGQLQKHSLTVPHRGQAPSHIGLVFGLETGHYPETKRLQIDVGAVAGAEGPNTFLPTHEVQMWEGACPRWRWFSQKCAY